MSKYKVIIFVVVSMIAIFLSGLFLAPKFFENKVTKEDISDTVGYVLNNDSEDVVNNNDGNTESNDVVNPKEEDSEQLSEEVSFINDEIRDENYKKFVEEYVPEYTPMEIDSQNIENLNNKLEDVDFSEMSLSFSNFIWWLDKMFPNVVSDFTYTAEVDRETNFIVVSYNKEDESKFQENKQLLTDWILQVSKHSFFHTKFGTNIKFIAK